jgi:phenylalanyl-tRNA synthetase beta chain
MKISYHWLQQYINTTLNPNDLGKVLTNTGLEVESIAPIELIKGGLQGLIIGEVMTCIKHPNADMLSITTVNIGSQVLNIVCGAPNVAAGQRVVVATVGTTVYPLVGEPFIIKKAKIRGEASEGMICAEDEIGLGASHAGIMVLPNDAAVGTPAALYFDVDNDYVFEIGLTPNRIDAASHIGVARDVAAALNLDLKYPETPPITNVPSPKNIDINIQNPAGCPRFSGIVIQNATIAPSPDWLQKRLIAIGLNPINNAVDITNYVMHEMGKPIHAFDAKYLPNNAIIVRNAQQNEKITLLDKKEYTLHTADLVIANQHNEPMALAGIMGGLQHSINTETTDIFIESAYFDPATIRQSAKRHQLKTDASFRFERGADINATTTSILRAVQLITEICGGRVATNLADDYPNPVQSTEIILDFDYLDKLIGIKIPVADVQRIVKKLDFEITHETPENIQLIPPTYRPDIKSPADVAEEILRIYGYNNVPLDTHIAYHTGYPLRSFHTDLRNQMADFLAANAYQEIMCNSLTSAAHLNLDTTLQGTEITLENPLSEDLNIMRPTMLWGGLQTIAHNINRQQKDLKIFEFGKTYQYNAAGKTTETPTLSLWITGQNHPETWYQPNAKTDFYRLNAAVQALLKKFNFENINTVEVVENQQINPSITYKQGTATIAQVGKVTPKVLKNFGIKNDVYYAELNLEKLYKTYERKKINYTEVPKFFSVRRDLALVVNKDTTYQQLYAVAQKTERKLIQTIGIFDVYEGDKIGADKKQYALGFTLQDNEKTLTDAQIENVMTRLMAAFEKELGATLR